MWSYKLFNSNYAKHLAYKFKTPLFDVVKHIKSGEKNCQLLYQILFE